MLRESNGQQTHTRHNEPTTTATTPPRPHQTRHHAGDRGSKRDFFYGLIQHGHAYTQVATSFLSIMVQHIQSPHARDEIKLITYATYFRDGHAPAPNYTSHTEGQRVEEVEVATAVADMAVAVAAGLAVAMIILAVVATVATVATTAASWSEDVQPCMTVLDPKTQKESQAKA
jgi:hypothetical protein